MTTPPRVAPPVRLPRWMPALAALAWVFAAWVSVFLFVVRPWYLDWGATASEAARRLPGDDIIPNATEWDTATRAITIDAPVAAVWPWLAQLGQDRGGFYSFELLEDLAGAEMENADRLFPELQRWKVGDKLWMYPPDKLGGVGHARLVAIDPGRVLAFATRVVGTPADVAYNGSWTFVLEPIDDRTTRLLIRGRAGATRGFFATPFDHFVFEPIHFVMERRMMEGLKQRAEGGRASEVADVAQVLLWTITWGLLVTGVVQVLRRRNWLRSLLAVGAAGLLFLLLTMVQPSPVFGAPLVLVLVALLWLPLPAARRQGSSARGVHPLPA